MPEQTISVEKFSGLTELPLYSQGPGKLKAQKNMRVTVDGMLEARGGLESLRPNGGTSTAPIAAGFYVGAHEHNSPVATIMRRSSVGAFSNNLSLQAYFPYFADTPVGTRVYFIAPQKFSRISLLIGTAGVGGYTIVWKYIDSTGTAQVLAGPTEDFKVAGARTVSFSPPATWGLNVVNNVHGYVIYAETATAVIGTQPTQKDQKVFVDWQGMKEIYVASSNGAGGTANGTVKRLSSDGAATPTLANTTVTSSLSSSSDPRIRFASWRGYMYFLNGIESKRYNLDSLADIGYTAPTGALTTAIGAGTGLTGLFRYAVTYGYGAAGELGESNAFYQTDADRGPANQDVTVTISGLTGTPAAGLVDVIYVYRSVPLNAATSSASYGAFPFYRVKTVTRDATGAFPATVTDNIQAVPQPVKTLDIVPNTPPTQCQFITPHRSRMFYARNPQYPGRVWWSKNFEPESVNQDEDFADFTRGTGGVITKIIEFADQIVVHTEDATYGIANVDQDVPNVYIIAAGVGCIAPEGGVILNGVYYWPGRGGLYAWDGVAQFDSEKNLVSRDVPVSLKTLSIEKHGGTRAVAWRDVYSTVFIDNQNTLTNLSKFEHVSSSRTWNTILHATTDPNLAPLLTFTAPPWHEDAGARHVLWGKAQASGTDYNVYMGEFKTNDGGNSYTCTASVHFGPAKQKVISPKRFSVIHNFTPANVTMDFSNLSYIGDTPALGTVFHDNASDYCYSQAPVTQMVSYTADLVGSFAATMSGAGVSNSNYLMSAHVQGNVMDQPMRTT